MRKAPCVLCERAKAGELLAESEDAVSFLDAFPVAKGHALVIPRRCEPNLLHLPAAEQAAVWSLLPEVTTKLIELLGPNSFNIGINLGPAAGQTVPHAHVHVIPRYVGDVPDPRGGVRWVLPATAAYWKKK